MDANKIIVRAETPNDYPKVYNLNYEAFGRSEEAQLVDRLRSGNAYIDGLSMVAVVDDKIVGHILFTKLDIVDGEQRHPSLALAPMAVLPAYQSKGIGSALVKKGLKIVKGLGYDSVIVLGHDTFYPKFGFVPANKWGIKAPFNVPDSAFMALELNEGALHNSYGTVEYPREFDDV